MPTENQMDETERTDAGSVEEFATGRFKFIDFHGQEIGVVRLASGQFRAVRNYCPHKGAPICAGIIGGTWPPCEPNMLQFNRDGEILMCPWHGLEYDLNTGREMFNTGSTRLRMFPVSVEDGRVIVSQR
jgi:nitrite reductase (NADH) small subunit